MNDKALERARRGAAWLDKMLGPGWRRKIKRRRLDMSIGRFPCSYGCGCILAQLFGSYHDGAAEVGLADAYGNRAVSLGFYSPKDYEALTEAWRQVLREGAPS